MKTITNLEKRLSELENKTNLKPRIFEIPELRRLMNEYEAQDPEQTTAKICEYYEKHYGAIEVETDPGLIFGMVLV